MRKILRFLGSANFLIPFFTLILSICVWFFSPYVGAGSWHPFDSVAVRLVVILLMWLVALVVLLVVHLMRSRHDKELADDIASATDSDPADETVKAELSDLRDKLKTALTQLRKSKGGRKHLYQLPWYVMIGPPGAGKTTAIVNSGLNFPLAETMGKGAIGGVGGTRNCDWWFTENAVLIDTAGRYTTQESDAALDNSAWLGFLGLLKRHRKRQPINGAMIAISLADLSLQDETTQMAHARAVRRRLHELREKLGVRFPVYVMFTKADLIAGFTEFYDSLGKEDREQVWGFTLPLDKSKGEMSPIASFDEEFAALLGRLNAQLLEKMQAETDHQRRSLIAGFPSQVASVRGIARAFLNEVFLDSRFEERHMLRGVYFTSGTQEGTPIDRLMMGMAKTFGIGRQAIGTGKGTGRSFFLTRLFEGVIFPEAGLVSVDDKVERRYRWTVRGAIAATAVWTRSYLGNTAMLDTVQAQIGAYRTASAQIPGNPIGDTDLPGIVDALNILRNLPTNPIADQQARVAGTYVPPPASMGYGLYQGGVVGNQAGQTYRGALNQFLLPRLLLRVEEQLQANMQNPNLLYEGLKVYLMLGLQGPMNKQLVTDWMTIDWSLSYAGPSRDQLRADLTGHLDALLSQPMVKVDLNGPLIEQIQGILAEMPMAQRVYNGIINSAAATQIPDFRITEVGGPAVSRVLVRSSGKPLSEGIKGIYTYDGFRNVFLPAALSVAERIQKESWVLGPRGEAQQTDAALLALSRDVLNLYYDDFVAQYDQLLSDIDIIPMESLSHAVEVTNVLSGSTSPIVNILKAVNTQTKLAEDNRAVDTGAAATGAADVIAEDLRQDMTGRNQQLLAALTESVNSGGGEVQKPPGSYVQDRFDWLHQLVDAQEGQASQLDDLMAALTGVYQELNKMAFSGGTAQPSESQALLAFQQAASRVQGPLQRWAAQITTGSSGIAADGTRASMNAIWQSQILPFCQQATKNVYPFNHAAAADMGLQDFQKLFAPNGLIDAFFTEQLAKYVDMRQRPWTWKAANGADLGISPAVLLQLQYAEEIKEAFFSQGDKPSVTFQLTPMALDPKARSMSLEIDGQAVDYDGGAPNPVPVTWPGAVGLARLTFKPDLGNTESLVSKDGPWAWFRLLDGAQLRDTNVSDRKKLIFNVGGRIAIYQMQSSSVINPFSLTALTKFSCPESF